MNHQPTSTPTPAPPAPPQPWDRQEGESQDAFSAFSAYLNLGPRATLKQLFEAINPDPEKPERTLKSLQTLSWRFNWADRAAAWRQHLAQLQIQPLQKLLADTSALWAQRADALRQQQWEFFHTLKEIAHQACQQVLDGNVQTPRFDEIPRIYSALIKVARQSFQLPPGAPLPAQDQPISLELEMALNKVYGPIAASGTIPDLKALLDRDRLPAQPATPAGTSASPAGTGSTRSPSNSGSGPSASSPSAPAAPDTPKP